MLAVLFSLCSSIPSISDISLTKEEFCSKAWRYDFECALDYMLSDDELQKIAPLAEKLRGEDCKDTAWNVLKWVDINMEYDTEKAYLPPPQIVIRGKDVEIYDSGRIIQTPSETLKLKRGICTDYAFLTLALLKYNGCEGYLVNVTFRERGEGHIAAAIEVNGTFFILDQHLPPFDPEGYYLKWAKDGREIETVEIYVGNTTIPLNSNQGYMIAEKDLRALESLLSKRFEEDGLRRDGSLNGEKLPQGYKEGYIFKLTLEMADYYHPEFEEHYADYIHDKLSESIENNYRAFNVVVSVSGSNLEVLLYLAT
jgi:predicted transglutaminase-like protease